MTDLAVHRLFGMGVEGTWEHLVLSPIPMMWDALSEHAQFQMCSQAWFPAAALHHRFGRSLLVKLRPGVVASTDCLHFLQAADIVVGTVVFFGLAGSLNRDIAVGEIVTPESVDRLEATSSVFSHDVRGFGISPPPEATADRSIRYGGRCASLPSLAHETSGQLSTLVAEGFDLVDLELASIAAWCAQRGFQLLPLLVVSDHPESVPIWNQDSVDLAVLDSVHMVVRHICATIALE